MKRFNRYIGAIKSRESLKCYGIITIQWTWQNLKDSDPNLHGGKFMEASIVRDGLKDKLLICDDAIQMERVLNKKGISKSSIIQRIRRFHAIVNESTEKLI